MKFIKAINISGKIVIMNVDHISCFEEYGENKTIVFLTKGWTRDSFKIHISEFEKIIQSINEDVVMYDLTKKP